MTLPIRLLVVDDSGFIRTLVRRIVQQESGIEVVGEAANGIEAVELVRQLAPDVVTMDVRMPRMDGVEAVRAIMAERPIPILMLSSFTAEGAPDSVRALRAGAVEVISKASPGGSGEIPQIDRSLCDKVRYWGTHPLPPPRAARSAAPAGAQPKGISPPLPVDLVVVGVSTGGPTTLPVMLKATGRLRCPVVVAQHMPAMFTANLAKTLRRDTDLDVVEGQDGMALDRPMVVILPGSRDARVERGANGVMVVRTLLDREELVHPSANVLFASALEAARSPVAVLLTGMGRDGAREAARFAARGFPVVVQMPETCVVGGMPQSAIDAGAASHVLDIEDVGSCLRGWCGA